MDNVFKNYLYILNAFIQIIDTNEYYIGNM